MGNSSSNYAQPQSKQLNLNSSNAATNEQGNPLPYLAGKRRFSGTFISDAFDQRTTQQGGGGGKDSGKGGGGSGTNYYASFAVAFCLGPCDGFHDLFLNGDAVYTGNTPLHPVSLTETSNVATFQTVNDHGLTTGQTVVITGADQTEFNGEFVITVVSSKQFQYIIPGTTLSAETASGQIAAWIKLDPIYRGTEESITITIPNYGEMTLYWGSETQPANAYLQVSGSKHSPMHGVCYAVFKRFFLGLNQTNIQNIEIVLSRTPKAAWLADPAEASIENDVNPAVAFYELLTWSRVGIGLADADFNLPALASAATKFKAEGLGISPLITRADNALSLVQTLCDTVAAMPLLDANGLLMLAPLRAAADYTLLPVVNDAVLADIPKPKSADWSNTYNETRLVFPNQDAAWTNDFTEWKDFAASTAVQRLAQPQTLQREWITRRTLAAALVQAAGVGSAVPAQTGTLEIIFTAARWAALAPGSLFRLDYSLRSSAAGYFRVTRRTLADPAKPVFSLDYTADRSYVNFNSAGLAPAPHIVGAPRVPALAEVPENSNFALVELPLAICPAGKPALAPLIGRDQGTTVAAKLYLGRNFVFNGVAPESFLPLATITHFAFRGRLAADFPAAAAYLAIANALPAEATDDPFPLVEGMAIQLDGPDVILPEVCDFDALANTLLLFVDDEIMSVAAATLTGAGAYDLTVIRGRLGTAIADHLTDAPIYLMPLADLQPIQHPHFLGGNTARFKLTLGTQQPEDVTAFDQVLAGTRW